MRPNTWVRFLALAFTLAGLVMTATGVAMSSYSTYENFASGLASGTSFSYLLYGYINPERLWRNGGGIAATGLILLFMGALLHLARRATESLEEGRELGDD